MNDSSYIFTKNLESKVRSGAEILVDTLNRLNVEYIFGHTGGAVIPIYVEINKRLRNHEKTPKVVMYRKESGAGHAAEGYSRSSGKTSVVLVTSGPGATNILTPLSDAYADSVPVIFITGQVNSNLLGEDAFQKVPITEMARLRTKYAYCVKNPEEIETQVLKAFNIAHSGRPGPVLIDICRDASMKKSRSSINTNDILGYNKKINHELDLSLIDTMLDDLSHSKKPLIYAGGGVTLSESSYLLRHFIERYNLPVSLTFMNLGAVPGDHELNLGMPGMHGTVVSNYSALNSDFIVALGARFDDRVYFTGFGNNAKIAHVDIDNSEINKIRKVDYEINGNVKRFLEYALSKKLSFNDLKEWHKEIDEWRKLKPSYNRSSDIIKPQIFIEELSDITKGNAIITTGVGQHQIWTSQYYNFHNPRSFINSGGLGTMGFGLPAAIGACFANPDKRIICIDGDGSFQMNMQELATIVLNKLPIKTFILNNGYLGMPHEWEDLFFDGNHFESCLNRSSECDPACCEKKDCRKNVPDFEKLNLLYPGLKTRRIIQPKEITPVIKEVLSDNYPWVVDVYIDKDEMVLPIIPPGGGIKDIIY